MLDCPWCGSNTEILVQNKSESAFSVQVRCANKKCHATCPNGVFTTEKMSLKDAEKKAIKAWNTRAPKRRM